MKRESYRILATNPRSSRGEAEAVIRGRSKYYLITPTQAGLFEIYYGDRYLGESTSLKGAEKFLARGGAPAPVLIANPNGGYEMYKYKSPGETQTNPKKKSSKKKVSKKKAAKKKTKKKTTKKKTTKKKAAKKKTTKRNPAKKNPKKTSPKKASKKKPSKKKVSKKPSKKAVKKNASKKDAKDIKKVSLDAAVRNHIAKTTGRRPAW